MGKKEEDLEALVSERTLELVRANEALRAELDEHKRTTKSLRESEELFRLIAENIVEVFWMADVPIERMFYISPGYERVWGRTCESLYRDPRGFLDAVHPEDQERVLAGLEAEKSGLPFSHEYRIIRPDGSVRWVWDRGYPVRDGAGRVTRYVGIALDITLRKTAEEALRESEERFRNMAEATSDWVWEVDGNGVYTYASSKVRDILGYEPEEIIGKTPFDLMDPVEAKRVAKAFASIAASKSPFSMLENANLRRDGRTVVLETSGVPIFGKRGDLLGYRGIDRDITERKRLEEELKRLATTDSLTGAYNRVRFDEIIMRELSRARRYDRPLSVSIFDIDDFKKINDAYGHNAGDQVLRKVADTARKNVRETSYLFRWGGEEFIILLPETDAEGARIQAERIRKAIGELEFGEAAPVTVSFGIALYSANDTIDSLVKRADDALYRAKTNGKNRVEKDA